MKALGIAVKLAPLDARWNTSCSGTGLQNFFVGSCRNCAVLNGKVSIVVVALSDAAITDACKVLHLDICGLFTPLADTYSTMSIESRTNRRHRCPLCPSSFRSVPTEDDLSVFSQLKLLRTMPINVSMIEGSTWAFKQATTNSL